MWVYCLLMMGEVILHKEAVKTLRRGRKRTLLRLQSYKWGDQDALAYSVSNR